EVEPVVLEGIGHFVEHDETDFRVGQMCAGDAPGVLRSPSVALLVLGFPSEAFAADMPGDIRLLPEKRFFAGVRTTLDELHDADLQAMAEGAGDDAERGRGLAFAVAGVDHEDAAFFLRHGDLAVDDGLLLLHALFVGNHVYSGMKQRWPRSSICRRP